MRQVLQATDQDIFDQHQTSALRTLNAFAIDVISIRSAEDLFWYVARNVVGRLNFVDCVIYQADEDQTVLKQVAALGEKNPYDRTIINPLRIPFGEGITGRAAATREPIVVDDLLVNQNYIPDTQPARSEICVPLVSMGRVVGVIDSEHPDVGAFGAAELELLTTIAAMTSAKLELLAEAERSTRRYHDLVKSHGQLAEEISNRKALEAELFEARKLEAIGRLTGGFAHGFNNLLTVISGNLDLLQPDVTGQETRDCLRQARIAADRGADLIRDMLAFSQRMRLRPVPTDLNALVRSICERNARGIGENVELGLADAAPEVNVDPAATEIAIVNLMMNARDAMRPEGRLRLDTSEFVQCEAGSGDLQADLAPGRYVRLDVVDEGAGIDADVLQRIFDPFFTTKPVGHGTGLGLSMVQGFMKQSGGAVRVRSVRQQGTTFELYFPAAA